MTEGAPDPLAELADFVAEPRASALGAAVTRRLELLVLDSLGCAVLAAHLEPAEALLAAMEAVEPEGSARVWWHARRLSAPNAAMVNATAVHGFELDDITTSLGHYGSVTVPVALALADVHPRLEGAELLSALAAGIEVGLRVNECVGGTPHLELGFHGPSIFGTFAAAATASRVLRLSAEQVIDALGHAAQFTAGLMGAQHGGMGKRLLPGRAAHAGIIAAELAAHGFTSTPELLTGGYGSFPSAFTGGGERYDLTRLSDGLGTNLRAEKVNFKLYACRIPIHPSLEAIRAMRNDAPFDAADVIGVDVALPGGAFKSVGHPYHPGTAAAAQLNLRYCLSLMMLEGDLFDAQFRPERLADPEVLELANRITVRHDPALDGEGQEQVAAAATVEVTLADGRRLRGTGTQPGTLAPIAEEVVIAKFRRMCAGALPIERTEALERACLSISSAADLSDLEPLLSP